MPVETPTMFSQIIQDHLELKQRNAELEDTMPIGRYQGVDPFDNHPLFKTEEQARIEETMSGDEPAIDVSAPLGTWLDEEPAAPEEPESGLWGRSRDFDWGD